MFAKQIGIDLGTVNVLVYVKGQGLVLQEPSVVAISQVDSRILAVGLDAKEMLGRVPESIEVNRPMKDGVVADYEVTKAMLKHFIKKAGGGWLSRPDVVISTPAGVTSVESRAVEHAAKEAGARNAYLLREPVAAALGAGMPAHTPTGNMVLDIGGGTTEAAVVSLYGIVVSSSVRVGGNKFDEAIAAYIRRKYNLVIGDQTAEQLKIEIGSAIPLDEQISLEIRGRDQVGGLPKTLTVTNKEIAEALVEPLEEVVKVVRNVLERTPPELISDIIDRGIVLTGGGALLRRLDELLTQETGVPCYVAENAQACVAIGAGKALDVYDLIARAAPIS
ncbi:MAG: rod shape-determining protein [Anaerolineales bacterium]|nr:rod shape-determining protein [Anaerolineales bacterium]MCB9128796.1 rod shape-determining protein [Ardenticatenales bacterium]MCB9171360.1 rod shape-determining protein [Ardenticatenales bacterium]